MTYEQAEKEKFLFTAGRLRAYNTNIAESNVHLVWLAYRRLVSKYVGLCNGTVIYPKRCLGSDGYIDDDKTGAYFDELRARFDDIVAHELGGLVRVDHNGQDPRGVMLYITWPWGQVSTL